MKVDELKTTPLKSAPYFYLKKKDGKVFIEGNRSCLLGHKLGDGTEGVFVEWEWNGRALTVISDKYGFYPVYYYVKGDAFCISTSIMQILELTQARDLDWPALSVFLRIGTFIKDETPFADIKALPPNVLMQWEGGCLSIRGGQYTIEKPLNIDRKAAIEEFIVLFRKAIEKRLPEDDNFIVPISGGRDSRRILLELNALGLRPGLCVTHQQYAPRSGEDVRISKLLTSALNIRHEIVEQYPDRFKSEIRKNRITGFCSDEHAQTLVLADHLENRTNTVYDGIAGMLAESFLMHPRHIQLYRQGDYSGLANSLFAQFSPAEKLLEKILNRETYKRIHPEYAAERLVNELKEHTHAPNPIGSFHFWNRTRREISLIPYAILGHIPLVYSPYLDHDLCRFLSSLPPSITEDGTFHTMTIQQAYPDFAGIPFEEKKTTGEDVTGLRRRYIKDLMQYYWSNRKLSSRAINNNFVLPRLVRALASGQYCRSAQWMPLDMLTYLIQLEGVDHG